ncbi:MAG: hypothetical protein ABI200_02310 [Gaiellales bacterium]
MKLLPTAPAASIAPASSIAPADAPMPPQKWARWWTSPIANVDYGANSRIPFWREARIPGARGFDNVLRPSLIWGGTTRQDAIAAAHLLAAAAVDVSFSFRNGVKRTVQIHPAIAVLHDAKAGAFWLTQLDTTVKLGDDWVDAPHSIDGPAFEGANALLRTPTVLSATRSMVAIVGRDTVLQPQRWDRAPHDSFVR